MRTITLELVRHGPPHNQLLSPLTQYLALCENHPAVTLQLPMEHNQMLYRLRALAYGMGSSPREFQLRDTAQVIGDLLARIPGLTADMNRRDGGSEFGSGPGDSDLATHLRLVLSASELALLPFELAVAPSGFPGAGNPMLLQSVRPVTITRETRGATAKDAAGDEKSPTRKDGDRLASNLTVLTEATLEAIEAACSEGNYTHVHILAHGREYNEGYDTRFGLMLHSADPSRPFDVVNGERLATALRCSRKGVSAQLARPAVVTLASCYGSGIASVTGVGASIAHALHADGIPLVIASQFPLSFGGSVRMVEMLYEGLLSGEDPRRLLIDLRRTLHTQFPETHDWASITAYSSLPPNFERQLGDVQIRQARRSIEVALDLADEVVAGVTRVRRSQKTPTKTGTTAPAVERAEIEAAMQRVREARERLAKLTNRSSQRGRIAGLLASADKREAALEYELLKVGFNPDSPAELNRRVWSLLDRARKLYNEAFGLDRAEYWAVVQFLSLHVVMQAAGQLPQSSQAMNGDIAKLWSLAEVQSRRDLSSLDHKRRQWALGNLTELYLLAPVIPELLQQQPAPVPNWEARAIQAAEDLAKMAETAAFEIFSTRRQIVRYLDFYAELCPGLEPALLIAEQVTQRLPAESPENITAG